MGDSYMMWKLIGGESRSQLVFEDLMKSALIYHYKDSKLKFVPADRAAHDAVFNLNSQDEVPLPMYGVTMSGLQLKELFITTVFAKEMEKEERFKGKAIFLTPPIRDEGADAGIFVVDPDGYYTDKDGFTVMTKETIEAIFQVKEYVDFDRMKNEKIIIPKPLDPKFFHIKKLKTYSQKTIILIFIRDSRAFTVLDLRVALKGLEDKKIYVILSFLTDVPLGDGKVIKLVPNCFNFLIIDVWADPQDIRHVWFEEPKSFKHT